MECVYSIVRTHVCIAQTISAARFHTMRVECKRVRTASLECSFSSLDESRAAAYRSLRVKPTKAIRDVVCRDARVRVTDVGEGKPLVLLHDFLSDRDEWGGVVDAFAERFRVVSVDLPGFGESEKPRPGRFAYDFDSFADAIVDVAAALDAAPFSVCGHGLGAAIAIALAERHSASVERVVLACPPIFGARAVSFSRAFAVPVVGSAVFKQLFGRRALARHFRRDVFHTPPSAIDARLARLFEELDAPAAREAAVTTLGALLDTRTVEARLARVAAPALVVWGRLDTLAPAAIAKKLVRDLPDARLELLDCGHSPAEEAPDAFAKRALDFLVAKRKAPARATSASRRA
jgi:pimeloyl-ACP methyl ester carboxylesterase